MHKLAAALLPLALGGAAPVHEPSPADIPEESIVLVWCQTTRGSAVSIAPGKYVTAAHVVDQPGCSVNGERIRDIEIHPGDFATFTGPVVPVAQRYCGGYRPGEAYYATGWPGGMMFRVTEVWVASNLMDGGQRAFAGNGYPGMSGGAVYDRYGRVVGVINRRWPTRSKPLRDTPICE